MSGGAYDKAKWHFGGEWPVGLPEAQSFVHTGFYLAWLVDRGLLSEEFERESAGSLTAFSARQLSGPKLFEAWDGVLAGDMLSDEGNAFSSAYYRASGENYLREFPRLFPATLPSAYHVQDSWENYEIVRRHLDGRFDEWRRAVEAKSATWGPGLPTEQQAGHRGFDDAARCLFARLGPLLEPHGFREIRSRGTLEAHDRTNGRRTMFHPSFNTFSSSTHVQIEACIGFDKIERLAWRCDGADEREARKKQTMSSTVIHRIGPRLGWESKRRDFGDVWESISSTVMGAGIALQDSVRTAADAAAYFQGVLDDSSIAISEHMVERHLCCLYHERDRAGLGTARGRWKVRAPTNPRIAHQADKVADFLLSHWDDDLEAVAVRSTR